MTFSQLDSISRALREWFDHYEQLDCEDAIKAIYLAEYCSLTMSIIIAHLEEVHLHERPTLELAEPHRADTILLDDFSENLTRSLRYTRLRT
jgi:hypothetical protein